MAWRAACKVCCGVGCVGKVCPRTNPAPDTFPSPTCLGSFRPRPPPLEERTASHGVPLSRMYLIVVLLIVVLLIVVLLIVVLLTVVPLMACISSACI